MKNERERTPSLETMAEALLSRITEEKMISIAPGDVRLIKYRATTDTTTETMYLGETEIVARIPLYETIVTDVAATVNGLKGAKKEKESRYEKLERKAIQPIKHPDFLAWKDSLPSPELYISAAQGIVQERGSLDSQEKIACQNCDGQKGFEQSCSCTFGGILFLDIVDDDPESTARLRPDGKPDPDCAICGGSGTHYEECRSCAGTGYAFKYPTLEVTNELTGQRDALLLDVAGLIAAGDIPVGYIHTSETVWPTMLIAEYPLTADLSTYIKDKIHAIGINPEQAVMTNEYGMATIEPNRFSMSLAFHSWRFQDGKVQLNAGMRRQKKAEQPTPKETIESYQESIAHQMAWPEGKILDENGVARAWEWRLHERVDFALALETLTEKVHSAGYRLGCKYSFIATEETAPAFFLLDQNDAVIAELGQDYRIEDALETALFQVESVLNRIQA